MMSSARVSTPVDEVVVGSDRQIPTGLLQCNTPVVLRGLVKQWPLVGAADRSAEAAVDYLSGFYNGKPCLVNFGRDSSGRYFYDEDVRRLNYDTLRAPIDDVLQKILQTMDSTAPSENDYSSYYVSSTSVDAFFPGLRERNNLQIPRVEADYSLVQPQMKIWIGNRSVASCHYDALDNIACCVAGRRRFTLFPPDQFKNLYFGPLDLTPGGQAISMVDFAEPDFERFPRFREAVAHGLVTELEPGDAIYIPSMWMHHVEGLSPFNVLVNYWWDDAPQFTGSGMNALYHGILSLRDKPAHEKEGWRQLFEYYVFGDAEHAGEHLPEHARGVLGKLDNASARQLRAMLINRLNR
ncbi:cupin-like domain-containing protein [Microbulbifer agarilyticus]|uniref:cupin-like domain-containing protein n=1 Tax=Microbulbifer agarilyticus TaxID=260552 RepID=UPI001C98490F|nr:cupin-like domain-containing protein [Microbulbifer agarilyticus]MBY6213004.1 cupin-like domain-containing protein [Microbulbifer agarilyticus]MCA0894577.1 cupin-like domain-containing protein [Microbulbifer agarilyticus]